MDWKIFCRLFATKGDFWQTTNVCRETDDLTLLSEKDGTTCADKLASETMVHRLKSLLGSEVVVSSEENVKEITTGFVIDPIDGSWNYKYNYPAYCRVVSYLEQNQVKFFAINNISEGRCVCSNGVDFLLDDQCYQLSKKEISPLISVMYNTHYDDLTKSKWLKYLAHLTQSSLNIRVSGSPSFDLYGLVTGSTGGVINLSPHAFDAQPIISCLENSSDFLVKTLINNGDVKGCFIGRPEIIKRWDF